MHLTFDDGPDGPNTAAVLGALRRAGARATFFVTPGRTPDLIRAIGEEGHQVAYHCGAHVRHSERTEREVRAEVERDLEWLGSIGVRPRAWRTPWGDLADWTPRVAAAYGLEVWGWSLDTEDWAGHGAPDMLTRAGTGLQEGAVVLMHDGIGPGARRADVANTTELIEPLCAVARSHGLRPRPLP